MRQSTIEPGWLVVALGARRCRRGAGSRRRQLRRAPAAPRSRGAAYTDSIQRAIALRPRPLGRAGCSRRAPGRRSAAAQRFLTPLLLATQRRQRPLTPSGFYYVPLSFGFSSYGPAVFALHVADGSEIITRHVGGPSLTFYVGNGRERYGSCTERLRPAQLAEGYLPIVQTSLRRRERRQIQAGVVRRQGLQRTVCRQLREARRRRDAQRALGRDGSARAVEAARALGAGPAGVQGWNAADRQRRRRVRRRRRSLSRPARRPDATVYAEWLNGPSEAKTLRADAPSYDAARVDRRQLLDDAAHVGHAVRRARAGRRRTLRSACSGRCWRSAGATASATRTRSSPSPRRSTRPRSRRNTASRTSRRRSCRSRCERLRKKPKRFTAFRAGHLLSTAATYYRLTRDRAFIQSETPELARLVAPDPEPARSRSGPARGRLHPEQLSSDIPYDVDSVNGVDRSLAGTARDGPRLERHRASRHRGAARARSRSASERPCARRCARRAGGCPTAPSSCPTRSMRRTPARTTS